ncbi:MAG: aminotransferase class V-fold PLP-dependent enzyme, partial [Myxococcales bacterium]|nr:aminotransferase class V-fold PLP-dependent enzyme [Myxococcales bacterium]
LLDAALEALDALAGVHVVGRPRERASVISFLVDGLHPSDVGTLLDGYGIAVRTGHHCAWPLMDRLGVPGTTRLSVGVYNTLDDIERFSRALTRIVERFAR